jgi:CheY-like chemotaxis protein
VTVVLIWVSRLSDPQQETLEGLSVLAVDDNDDSLELIKIILDEYGIRVITATSANEALDAIAPRLCIPNARFLPDIIVCDIAMPEQDGYWLIHQIRTLSPERGGLIPAIALTAFAIEEVSTRAIASGFQIYLSKPVDPSELVAAVAKLAERDFN